MGKLKPWHEWNMPPLWVFFVAGTVLIGLSTVVFWQISESMSSTARQSVAPAAAAPARNPNDPDSF